VLSAELANADAELKQARSAYNAVKWRNDLGRCPNRRRCSATNGYEAAQARYDVLAAGADADQIADARARVQRARAELDRVLAPGSARDISSAEAEVRREPACSWPNCKPVPARKQLPQQQPRSKRQKRRSCKSSWRSKRLACAPPLPA
jgi:hypothetical protein